MGEASLIQGSSLTAKCCRGENPMREFSREHVECTLYVVIGIVKFGKYSKRELKPKRG
jgi:hypothetical protein